MTLQPSTGKNFLTHSHLPSGSYLLKFLLLQPLPSGSLQDTFSHAPASSILLQRTLSSPPACLSEAVFICHGDHCSGPLTDLCFYSYRLIPCDLSSEPQSFLPMALQGLLVPSASGVPTATACLPALLPSPSPTHPVGLTSCVSPHSGLL